MVQTARSCATIDAERGRTASERVSPMADVDRIEAIITAPNLTYRQRLLQLALAAEADESP